MRERMGRRKEAHLMSVEEVGVRRVDVARLHRYHIGHKLRCGRHRRLEEIHDYTVEALTQRRIATERLLNTHEILEDDVCITIEAERTIFVSSWPRIRMSSS
jgi:hypothetical protein